MVKTIKDDQPRTYFDCTKCPAFCCSIYERMLKKVKDVIFPETCMFLDQERRGCTIYHARPGVCREYPDRSRCAYYDVLQFERRQQADDTVVPLVQITFREVKKGPEVDDKCEKVWEWQPEK